MKKWLLIYLLISVWAAGYSGTPPLKGLGDRFSGTNFIIHWQKQSNSLPATVWVFKSSQKILSDKIINYIAQSTLSFSKDQLHQGTQGYDYKSPDGLRHLYLNFPRGLINFEETINSSSSNLSEEIPTEKEVQKLAMKYLPEMGILLSDLEKNSSNSEPHLRVYSSTTTYFINKTFITNVDWREIHFRRLLDGKECVGMNAEGEIRFGNRGKITKIDITYPSVEKFKKFNTPSRKRIEQWMREGKCVQGRILMNLPPIDWEKVKLVNVMASKIIYVPSETWFSPIIALWTIVESDGRKIEVEIDCPAIEDYP